MRWLKYGIGALLIAVVAMISTDRLADYDMGRLRREIDELQQEKTAMQLYARRLSSSRRVAQVNVVERVESASGDPITRVRWQQIGPSGVIGPPELLELRGTQVYFEALVIKFEYDLIGHGDPDRGMSLAMFRRAFGDQQPATSGAPLDQTAPPEGQGEGNPDSLQARLWSRFWQLTTDPALAGEYGVRVAQCEAVSARMQVGQVWEISLDAAGGVNLRLIGDGLHADGVRKRVSEPAPIQ